METLFEKLGGRKFLFSMIILLTGLAVDLFTQRGLSVAFKELMIAVIAIYIAGNSVNKIASVVTKKAVGTDEEVLPETSVQTLDTETLDTITRIEQSQNAIMAATQANTQGIVEILKRSGGMV